MPRSSMLTFVDNNENNYYRLVLLPVHATLLSTVEVNKGLVSHSRGDSMKYISRHPSRTSSPSSSSLLPQVLQPERFQLRYHHKC